MKPMVRLGSFGFWDTLTDYTKLL